MKFKIEIKEKNNGGKMIIATTIDPDNDIVKVKIDYYKIKTMKQLKNKLAEIFEAPSKSIIIY